MKDSRTVNINLVRFAMVLLVLCAASCRKETSDEPVSRDYARASGDQSTGTTKLEATPDPASTEFVLEPGKSVDVGAMMPPYQSKWLDGKPFLLSDKRGKVVLLNIWATWCGPCRYEIPELQALHQELAGKGFEVIGVSVDDFGMEPSIREFVADKKMTYPVVHDPDGSVAALFNSTVLPTSALIDREGRLRWVYSGVVQRGNLGLKKALAEAL